MKNVLRWLAGLVPICAIAFAGCGGDSGKVIPAPPNFKPSMDSASTFDPGVGDPTKGAAPGGPGSADAGAVPGTAAPGTAAPATK
jgi:hypothetical protein